MYKYNIAYEYKEDFLFCCCRSMNVHCNPCTHHALSLFYYCDIALSSLLAWWTMLHDFSINKVNKLNAYSAAWDCPSVRERVGDRVKMSLICAASSSLMFFFFLSLFLSLIFMTERFLITVYCRPAIHSACQWAMQ